MRQTDWYSLPGRLAGPGRTPTRCQNATSRLPPRCQNSSPDWENAGQPSGPNSLNSRQLRFAVCDCLAIGSQFAFEILHQMPEVNFAAGRLGFGSVGGDGLGRRRVALVERPSPDILRDPVAADPGWLGTRGESPSPNLASPRPRRPSLGAHHCGNPRFALDPGCLGSTPTKRGPRLARSTPQNVQITGSIRGLAGQSAAFADFCVRNPVDHATNRSGGRSSRDSMPDLNCPTRNAE